MNVFDDPEFEPTLRRSMVARPEPASISNLAFRAMQRAREQIRLAAAEQLRALSRLRRRSRWVGIVAAVLIAAVVALGAKKLANGGSLSVSSTATTSADSTSSDNAASTGAGSVTLGVAITAELLVVAMILLSAGAASSRPVQGEPIFY